MGDLPVPQVLRKTEDAIENGGGMVQGSLGIQPLKFQEVEIGKHQVKYTFRKGDAVFQFFRSDGGLYPASFRNKLFGAFSQWPPPNKGLDIQWVEELQSWSVIVKSGGTTPPGPEDIDHILVNAVS